MSKVPKKADGDFVMPEWWPTEEELLASLNEQPATDEAWEVTLIVPSPRPRRSTLDQVAPIEISRSELEDLRRHEVNATAYEETMREVLKTIRAVEGDIHGGDPVKAAWAEGWVACAVTLAQAIKKANAGTR